MMHTFSKIRKDKSINYCCAVTKNGIYDFHRGSLSIFNSFANTCMIS